MGDQHGLGRRNDPRQEDQGARKAFVEIDAIVVRDYNLLTDLCMVTIFTQIKVRWTDKWKNVS
jgi:hypothetical protein